MKQMAKQWKWLWMKLLTFYGKETAWQTTGFINMAGAIVIVHIVTCRM